jgi:hypothetical protein
MNPGGRPPKKPGERLDVQFALRLDTATAARLDEVAGRWSGLTKPAIARAAIAFGLDVIDRDPAILFFKSEKERTERILARYWRADAETGGAEVDEIEKTYAVWILPRRPDGALIEGAARVIAHSRASFRHAVDALATLSAPLRPLPWWPNPRHGGTAIGMPRRPFF